MIAEFEDAAAPNHTDRRLPPLRHWAWGTSTSPEMQAPRRARRTARCSRRRSAAICKGMIVEVPLAAGRAAGRPAVADIHAALCRAPTRASASSRWPRLATPEATADARSRGPERHQPHAAVRVRLRRRAARPGWSRCSTISARARRARRCRTSTSCWAWTRAPACQITEREIGRCNPTRRAARINGHDNATRFALTRRSPVQGVPLQSALRPQPVRATASPIPTRPRPGGS